jgi:hypothetical protein
VVRDAEGYVLLDDEDRGGAIEVVLQKAS